MKITNENMDIPTHKSANGSGPNISHWPGDYVKTQLHYAFALVVIHQDTVKLSTNSSGGKTM